jgi:hypothetical protein
MAWTIPGRREDSMLFTLAVILFVAWLLGVFGG